MNSFDWFEYKYTVVANGKTSYMTLRVDYKDDSYNGIPAKRFKMDMVMEQDTSMYFDVYTDPADESVLGGHVKMTIAGQTIVDEDIKPDQGENYAKQNPAFSYGSDSDEQLIPGETETITVPAGTYVCTKYTIDSEKGKEYIWMAPGVPVPIKVVSESPEGINTGELVGWG
ncbi:hypothetical protein CUJ83_06100 [Methanocella sp. CWC-04]|uniref:Uncharacterized protein n=2 Tax=Methanooceanicella nereidis TaxID=2052831 RepID=A0AAP2RBS7_9EURY|nr:hypothetical protein [Methanocella sp. CWC-04]